MLVLVQPVCVFQPYELLLQQYFWLTVKYILLNYLKTFSHIHMADKSQIFFSVYSFNNTNLEIRRFNLVSFIQFHKILTAYFILYEYEFTGKIMSLI